MRCVRLIAVFCLLLAAFTVRCACVGDDTGELLDSRLEQSGAKALYGEADTQTRELLNSLGIDDVDFKSIYDTSLHDIVSLILEIFKGRLAQPLTVLTRCVGIVLLLSIAQSFMPSDGNGLIMGIAGGVLLTVVAAVPMLGVISTAVSAVAMCSRFTLALVPVLTAIIAASGNTALAYCYSSAAFAAAQGMSLLASGFMPRCCGIIAGTGIIDSIAPELKISAVAQLVKKAAVWVFAASATLFTSFLSLKGILAGAADTMAVKGLKLAIDSVVPVVGSQLSQAYSAVASSITAARATVGAFGIACTVLTSLPVIIELTLWSAAMKAGAALSQLLGQKDSLPILHSLDSAASLMNACVIFNAAVTVISTGLVLAIKADL